jgi:hypothetical protein
MRALLLLSLHCFLPSPLSRDLLWPVKRNGSGS